MFCLISAVSSRQSQREAAERLKSLNIPGVEIFTPDDFADLTPEQQDVRNFICLKWSARRPL